MRRTGSILFLAHFSALACLPEFEKIPGEHLLYEHSSSLVPCGSNADFLNRTVAFLEGQLAITAPTPVRYSWLTSDDSGELRVPLEAMSSGITIGRHARGERPVIVHEVVHLITRPLVAPFFSEGVAVAYDPFQPDGTGPRYQQTIDFDPRRTMEARTSSEVDYTEAGLFVSYLLTTHGPERFQEFYRALAPPHSMERIRAAFRAAYGLELDGEVERFMTGPPSCEESAFHFQVIECSAPTIEWSAGGWAFADIMACDSPGVVGGLGPDQVWPSFEASTVEVPKKGRYELRMFGDPGVTARFGPCFGCPWDFRDIMLDQDQRVMVDLDSGKHYLRVNARSNESPRVGVVLTLVSPEQDEAG